MDRAGNGIPCETVYSHEDVAAYWPSGTVAHDGIDRLGPGLFCRDLRDRGVNVRDALRYYLREGQPSRMDADNNGIPCETVYGDAADVWAAEF